MAAWGQPEDRKPNQYVVYRQGKTEVFIQLNGGGGIQGISATGPDAVIHFLTKPSGTQSFIAIACNKTSMDRLSKLSRPADNGYADYGRPDYAGALNLTFTHSLDRGIEDAQIKFELPYGSNAKRTLGPDPSPGFGAPQSFFDLCMKKGVAKSMICTEVNLDLAEPAVKPMKVIFRKKISR